MAFHLLAELSGFIIQWGAEWVKCRAAAQWGKA